MTSSDRWRRIEEAFQAALEIPREQRDAYLADALREDADLRAEVESLLARDHEESSAISSIIEGTAASLFDDQTPPDAMLGAELGNYRIIREIGRGGMGAVYLAVRADQTFEKQVAIKLVKRGTDTDAVLRRFWYERRILAALEHPYIARLVDGGTSQDGRPYFVMEYVDGKPLDAYASEHNLSVGQCCEIIRRVCEAVSYAHRNLIIHRDLKPANILVTADGTPKLLDFGIARLLSVDPGEATIAGHAIGPALTPEFASPEQARGEAVTTATDVYSLGATLQAILPANAPLPGDLATIIGKATREESEQRFPSVADFSEDLRRYLAGMPIMAREQTLAYQAGKFVRRHRLGVGVFALFNLMAFAGLTAIVWESHRADTERKAAELRLSQAVGLAEQTLEYVNGSIAFLPGTIEPRRKMVRNTLDYLNQLSKDSSNDPRVLTALATAYVRVGEVLGNSDFPNLGDLPGSLATYQRALGVIQPLLDDDPENLRLELLATEGHDGTGNVLQSLGRDKDAEAQYRASIAIADAAFRQNPDNPEAQFREIEAHYALSWLLYSPDPKAAEEDMRKQLPLAIQLASRHPEMPNAMNKLSEIYSLIGTAMNRESRLEESLAYYRKAVEVRESVYRQNPRNSNFQRNLMMGYGHIGDVLGSPFTGCLAEYGRALDYYRKAADIAEDMSRADPSDQRARFDIAMIWARIGATRQAARDLRSANQALDRAIAQFEKLIASSPANAAYARGVSIAYEYRGRNTWLLGDRGSAMAWYQKSLAMTEKLLASRPADLSARSQRLADKGPIAALLALAGDRAGAVKQSSEMINDANDYSRNRSGYHLARAWWWYGQTYEALGDFRTAADAYAKAADTWKKVPGIAGIPQYQVYLADALHKAAECRRRAPARTQPASKGDL